MYWLRIILMFMTISLIGGCQSKHERANERFERAQELLQQGAIDSAKIEFNNVLSLESNRVDALSGLATILEKEKNWPQLLRFLLKIIELDPDNAPARVKLGNLYLASGQIDPAQKQLDVLKSIAPQQTDTWVLDANLQLILGNEAGALLAIDKALSMDNKNTDALWLLARTKMAAGDYDAALPTLDRGIAANPQNVFFYATKVRALNELKQYDQGVQVFKDLIKIDPQNPAFHRILAKQYLEQGKVDLAAETLETFAENYPSDVSLLNVIQFYQLHRSAAETMAVIERYIERYPNQLLLRFSLADFYLELGDFEKARAALTHAVADTSGEAEQLLVKNQFALLALAEGRNQEAMDITADILKQDPQNIKAITTQARVELNNDHAESAIRLLRSALHNNSQDPFVLYLLASAHDQQGMTDLARDHYQRAMVLSDFNEKIVLDYVQFLIKHNNLSLAEEVLSKSPTEGSYAQNIIRNNLAYLLLSEDDPPSHKRGLTLIQPLSDLAVPQFQDTVGWAYYRAGDATKALEHLLQAKPALKEVPEYHFHLGAVYLALGKSTEAKIQLEAAKAKAPDDALWLNELNKLLQTAKSE